PATRRAAGGDRPGLPRGSQLRADWLGTHSSPGKDRAKAGWPWFSGWEAMRAWRRQEAICPQKECALNSDEGRSGSAGEVVANRRGDVKRLRMGGSTPVAGWRTAD